MGRGLAIFVKVTRCAGHLPVVSWPHVCPFSSVQQLGSQDQLDPGPAGLLSGRVAGRPAGAEEAAGREQAAFAPPAAGWGGRRLGPRGQQASLSGDSRVSRGRWRAARWRTGRVSSPRLSSARPHAPRALPSGSAGPRPLL